MDQPTKDELRQALEELVQLQAHYAELLNMHDGGQRHAFRSVDEYLERLRELRRKGAETWARDPIRKQKAPRR
jgi:hypothetical protein